MKFTSQLAAGLAFVGLLAVASAEDAIKFNVPGVNSTPSSTPPAKSAPAASAAAPSAAPSAPAAAPVKYTDIQLLEAYGYIFAVQSQLAQQTQAFEFTQAQKDAVARGVTLALTGKEIDVDPKQVQEQLREFMSKKQDAYLGKVRTAFTSATNEYFAKLKENKAVTILPSGLGVEIVKPGTGPVAKPGQVVVAKYVGMLVNGQAFGGTDERTGPARFLLKEPIIPGLLEGLQKTGVGGQLRLHIPPNLAYGDQGDEGIPPGAALIFAVEIVGVEDAPKEAGK